MGILTFKGGVHPYDGKELSKNSPVVKYLPKGDMVYPLSQHIGAPAAAIVQKGDHVLAGQKIADAAGFVSSPIHSSVSGTVKGIEPRLTATGSMVNSIIIENDQQYESVEFTPARLEDLSKEEILARIKEGGVVGMGGAGFPTQVKLAPKEPDKIDHILVNGAECEPYLTSDYRRMLDDSEKLIEGLRVMLKLFDNAKGYICIEDNKPDCIAKLKEMVKDIPRIEVAVISESAELQITIPLHPAAQSCSTEAVTCSDTCPWSTYITLTPRASAALSMIFLLWLPSTSVELQIDTPIVMSSSAACAVTAPAGKEPTIAAVAAIATAFLILFFML